MTTNDNINEGIRKLKHNKLIIKSHALKV